MTDPTDNLDPAENPDVIEPAEDTTPDDVQPPQTGLAAPPPLPQPKVGFFRRLFMSRKKQQALAVQNGYLEMVDLIRAIRAHLDRQEAVQGRVLSMLEMVPGAMERQNDVMTLFKQQLENSMDNDQQLADTMGRLNGTLDAMNESQKTSSRTITDLIGRSRETELLLREVMRRAERRMNLLIVIFLVLVIGGGFYFFRTASRSAPPPTDAKPAKTQVAEPKPEPPTEAKPAPAKTEPKKADKPAKETKAPAVKPKKEKKAEPAREPAPVKAE